MDFLKFVRNMSKQLEMPSFKEAWEMLLINRKMKVINNEELLCYWTKLTVGEESYKQDAGQSNGTEA